MSTLDNLLQCPLTLELFVDPVLAQDGHTYERKAIEEWIQRTGTSPITREPLSIEQIRPNRIVKGLVEVFETSMQQKNYEFILNVDVKKKERRPLFQTPGKTIYHAEWLPDNKNRPEIVLLRIDGTQAKKEASFYVNLSRHPHIVRTFGLVHDENNPNQDTTILLLQEYAPEGSLYELLYERRTAPDEKILVTMFLQIIDAMICLAYNHVVHGDLACRNVLVFRYDENEPEKIVVKITDFGLSRHSQLYSMTPGAARTTVNIVPVRYAAPEVLSPNTTSEIYTEKSDVYSMGVLMWEAYCRGSSPWVDVEHDNDVIRRVRNGDLLPQPPNCTQPFWSIITKTWCQSPNDRPKFSELKHLLTEQYYRAGWMLEGMSERVYSSIKDNLTESKRNETERKKEEQDGRLVQHQQEEQDRRLAQKRQEEQDRRLAQRQQEEQDRRLARQKQEEQDRRLARQKQEEQDRRLAQRQQEEENRRVAQQKQKEQDRRMAQRKQEEEDRKLAEKYASLEKRELEKRFESTTRAEPLRPVSSRGQQGITLVCGIPPSRTAAATANEHPYIATLRATYDRDYVHGDRATRTRYAHAYDNFASANPHLLRVPMISSDSDNYCEVPHPDKW